MLRARYRKPIQRLPIARYKHRARQPYYTPRPTNVYLRWTEVSHREARKTWCAHVVRSPIQHLPTARYKHQTRQPYYTPPPTNVHLRWTVVSHREARQARKTWCAHVTENQFNAYLEHATNTEHASLIILLPQQTYTFGGQGLATEKHVKHGARTLQETNSTLT